MRERLRKAIVKSLVDSLISEVIMTMVRKGGASDIPRLMQVHHAS